MTTSELSELERKLVELIATENWIGLSTDGIRVLDRRTTGVGRYTYLEDTRNQRWPDGTFTAQGRLLEIEGIRSGLAFMVTVRQGKLRYLELVLYGDESWDGVDRNWRIS